MLSWFDRIFQEGDSGDCRRVVFRRDSRRVGDHRKPDTLRGRSYCGLSDVHRRTDDGRNRFLYAEVGI